MKSQYTDINIMFEVCVIASHKPSNSGAYVKTLSYVHVTSGDSAAGADRCRIQERKHLVENSTDKPTQGM